MERLAYRLHGLNISSELPLGEPVSSSDTGKRATADAFDLTMEAEAGTVDVPHGTVIAALTDGVHRYYTGTEHAEGYTFRIHGLCDFHVDAAVTSVVCAPGPDSSIEQLALLARGALVAFVLGLRGDCVLHASVVESDRGSIAIAGNSGSGKSTVAALACRDGARFVSDDLLRLGAADPPSWVGRSHELRLRPGAAALAEGGSTSWSPRHTVDGRVAVVPPRTLSDTGVIRAVVVPTPDRDQSALSLTRVEPTESVYLLSCFPRLSWTLPSVLANQFVGVSHLSDLVPVFQARIPWGPPFADRLGRDLMDQVLLDT